MSLTRTTGWEAMGSPSPAPSLEKEPISGSSREAKGGKEGAWETGTPSVPRTLQGLDVTVPRLGLVAGPQCGTSSLHLSTGPEVGCSCCNGSQCPKGHDSMDGKRKAWPLNSLLQVTSEGGMLWDVQAVYARLLKGHLESPHSGNLLAALSLLAAPDVGGAPCDPSCIQVRKEHPGPRHRAWTCWIRGLAMLVLLQLC